MRLLAAELLKIWTAPRTLFGILLAETVIVLIGVITTLDSAGSDPTRLLAQDVVSIASTSLLFATLLGVLIATTEYRHGTITLTFLATPARERVLAAKTGAAVIGSALLVLPAVLLTVGIAQIWVGGRDDYHFGSHEYALIGRQFLAAAIVATLGLFIGASFKRQLGAIILVLGWLVFVEHALSALFPGATNYLPGRSIGGILGDGGEDTPSFARALAVLSVYLVGLGAMAVVLTRRRDIT